MWSPALRGGEKRGGNRRKSGRKQGDPGAALAVKFAQRVFQRLGRRRAAAAIAVAGAMGDLIFGGGIKQRRRMIDRRIDEAVIGFGIAA